jgi:hypothetical protein
MSRSSTPSKLTTEDKNIDGNAEVKTAGMVPTGRTITERLVITDDDNGVDDSSVDNDGSRMADRGLNDEVDPLVNQMQELLNGIMRTFALSRSQISSQRSLKVNSNNSGTNTDRNSGIRHVNPSSNSNIGHSNINNTNALDVSVFSTNGNNIDPVNTSNASIHSDSSGNSKPAHHHDKPKMKIPTFNGNKINLTIYKAYRIKIKQYVSYYNITDMHPVFCQSLTDQALTWYLAYVEAHPDIVKDNCDKIIEVLDKEYFNPLSKSKYRVDYDTMKAKEGESIQELATRINNLASQAGLVLRSDEDKKNKLYTLLPLHLRAAQCNTLIDPNVTYEEFVTYVVQSKEVNDLLAQQQHPRSKHTYTTHNINDTYSDDGYDSYNVTNINNGNTNHDQRNNNYHRNNNNNNRNKNNKHRNNGTCFYCKKIGHNAISCYHLYQEYQLQKPDAVTFWNSHNMNEKLSHINNSNNNVISNQSNSNNGSSNNNTGPKNASTSNINNDSANNNTNNSGNINRTPSNNTNCNINTDDQKSLIYINGSVNNLPISHILLDEGSSFSLISKNTYTELLHHVGKSMRLALTKHDLPVLKQADGVTTMELIGSIRLDLRFDDINIGNFSFIIVDHLAHDVIIGRDIIAAANLSTINDNGTKVIQGLKLVESNIILPSNANIFSVRDTHIRNSKKIINNISAVMNTAISEDNVEKSLLEKNTTSEQLPSHLKGIFISNELNIEDRHKLINILIEYQDVFYKDGDPITPLNTTIRHTIRLIDNAKPVQAKLYSLPLSHRQAISEQVNNWLKMGILTPSYSPWSATCVVVDKKDQKLGRVCGNFKPLNALTVNDAYPLKRIEEQKESFSGCIIYSNIDLKDAYLQVLLDEKSKELTAIVTHDGLFEFTRMIQGLKTAPATFHRIIDDAFKDIIKICLAPYFDDLTVHSKSINDHFNH